MSGDAAQDDRSGQTVAEAVDTRRGRQRARRGAAAAGGRPFR